MTLGYSSPLVLVEEVMKTVLSQGRRAIEALRRTERLMATKDILIQILYHLRTPMR